MFYYLTMSGTGTRHGNRCRVQDIPNDTECCIVRTTTTTSEAGCFRWPLRKTQEMGCQCRVFSRLQAQFSTGVTTTRKARDSSGPSASATHRCSAKVDSAHLSASGESILVNSVTRCAAGDSRSSSIASMGTMSSEPKITFACDNNTRTISCRRPCGICSSLRGTYASSRSMTLGPG